MLRLEDGDWRIGISDAVMRMAIVERIRREAAHLVPIGLILNDQRAAPRDIIEQAAGVLANLVPDQVGIGTNDNGIKGMIPTPN